MLDFAGDDVIRFVGTSLDTFAEVLDAAIDTLAGALITIDDDASVTLAGVSLSSLNAEDFLFA